MSIWKRRHDTAGQVDVSRLPRHIAIIMDGNGRWAKRRGLPRTAGHKAGAETFRDIATYCKELGVSYLTVYAFSTENWKRPPEEVAAIMALLEKYLGEAIEKFKKQQKASDITEDDYKIAEKDLQKLTDDYCKELDELLAKKEKELMAV